MNPPKIGDQMTVYKWLRADLTSYQGYSWSEPGRVHRFSGQGLLCGAGHAHAYTSPQLALWLRPLHVSDKYCRLFPGQGVVSALDHGLKLGVRELVLDLAHEIVIPPGMPSPEQLVTAAIKTALVAVRAVSSARAAQWTAARAALCPAVTAARAALWTVERATQAALWPAVTAAQAALWTVEPAAQVALAAAEAVRALGAAAPGALDLDAIAAEALAPWPEVETR